MDATGEADRDAMLFSSRLGISSMLNDAEINLGQRYSISLITHLAKRVPASSEPVLLGASVTRSLAAASKGL